MSASLARLLPLFERERAAGRAMVFATVVDTAGPTYSKPGAHLLLAADGTYSGLLSGGCLEGDLAEQARTVLSTGRAACVRYDMRGPHDLLFGLGSGCEGAMQILLQRVDAAGDWQPMARLAGAWRSQRSERLVWIASSDHDALPAGATLFDDAAFGLTEARSEPLLPRLRSAVSERRQRAAEGYWPELLPGIDAYAMTQRAAQRLLLLGAGPDAMPVAHLADFLGWQVTVVDHRPHYADATRFPAARVLSGGAGRAAALLERESFGAAVVMSHHLATDRAYLEVLARHGTEYVGLLGPVVRTARLLVDMAEAGAALRPRLHAPVGLDLGGGTPEAIALAIVAEIQAHFSGRSGVRPLGNVEPPCPKPDN